MRHYLFLVATLLCTLPSLAMQDGGTHFSVYFTVVSGYKRSYKNGILTVSLANPLASLGGTITADHIQLIVPKEHEQYAYAKINFKARTLRINEMDFEPHQKIGGWCPIL